MFDISALHFLSPGRRGIDTLHEAKRFLFHHCFPIGLWVVLLIYKGPLHILDM